MAGKLVYRTYDAAWNRTGYSSVPQYSGQAGLSRDYPAKCACGAGMILWRAGGRTNDGYAECGNGHEMQQAAV